MWLNAMAEHFRKVGEEPTSKWGFIATGEQRCRFWEDWRRENVWIPDLYEYSYVRYYEGLIEAEREARWRKLLKDLGIEDDPRRLSGKWNW